MILVFPLPALRPNKRHSTLLIVLALFIPPLSYFFGFLKNLASLISGKFLGVDQNSLFSEDRDDTCKGFAYVRLLVWTLPSLLLSAVVSILVLFEN
jgi:hypothetical protein